MCSHCHSGSTSPGTCTCEGRMTRSAGTAQSPDHATSCRHLFYGIAVYRDMAPLLLFLFEGFITCYLVWLFRGCECLPAIQIVSEIRHVMDVNISVIVCFGFFHVTDMDDCVNPLLTIIIKGVSPFARRVARLQNRKLFENFTRTGPFPFIKGLLA